MSATVSSAGQRDGAEGGGRDACGRFAAGNRYGPGNPFARQTAELRKVLLEVVTPEEMRQVALTLLLLAKAGKLEATRLLFQYVLGKPAEAVDPDRLDVEEWKLSQESRVNPVAVKETVDHMPAETANVLVRHVWPASTETNYLSAAREELDAMDREDAERARAAQESPAETNGSGGEASPLTPDPSPPLRGRGEEEERGEVAARGGRSAKPQAAKGGSGAAPSTNGGGGANGRHRQSSGANGKAAGNGGRGRGAGGPQPPPLAPRGRGEKEGRTRSPKGGGENGGRAEANGGNGARPSPARGGGGPGRARCP